MCWAKLCRVLVFFLPGDGPILIVVVQHAVCPRTPSDDDEGDIMKKRIKSVIAGTAIAAVMATAAFGIAGEVGARPVTSNLGVANVGKSDDDRGERLASIASVLGMTGDELHTALHSGQSLAAIASSKGVSVQKVVDAVVAELKAHIAAEVASGELTQSEADTKLALVTAKATELVNSTRPEGGRARHGKGGHGAGEIGGNILPSVVVTETNA